MSSLERLQLLNSRERKKLLAMIEQQFGALAEEFEFYVNSKKKIFLINREIAGISLDKLRVNSLGMYLGEVHDDGIRLSIEGSQMIKNAKNVLVLDDTDAKRWMAGEDFELSTDLFSGQSAGLAGFAIIKNREDILGCGKVSKGKLYNYMPKERRVHLE